MNKPSERLVVFVTPAQKRAISATADGLGVSISELMRRAVLEFSATSDPVRAASIVDRLNAPREPDALAQVLRKAAKPLREKRASPLRPATSAVDAAVASADSTIACADATQEAVPEAATQPQALSNGHDVGSDTHEFAQTVARQNAQAPEPDAAFSDTANAVDDDPLQSLSVPFTPPRRPARPTRAHSDADTRHSGIDAFDGGMPEDGKFA